MKNNFTLVNALYTKKYNTVPSAQAQKLGTNTSD